MKKPRTLVINDDYTYFSDGTPLGKCEQCSETAYHFDENGSALCEDCLVENHENGLYFDEPDGPDPSDIARDYQDGLWGSDAPSQYDPR